MSSLAEESHLAGKVKKETPILVILGNPPYSGHSSNVGEWISDTIRDYYKVDGKPLGEKNPKWLQDDYVKFIRFAQWKIEQAGEGVLGFITNHSYLDNPTFRGMRQSLMNTFEQIYLLDLHGSTMKRERSPDGSKDENVFDITRGVAVGLFIKRADLQRRVCHAEIWGLREDKYIWLEENDISSTKWSQIYPKSAFYLFVPRDDALFASYQHYPALPQVFRVSNVGVVTSRDHFVIDFNNKTLKQRISMFRDKNLDDELIKQTFELEDKTGWNISDCRKAIIEDRKWEEKFTAILYRPFDTRWIFYHDAAIERPRKEVMRHMLKENLGLVSARSNKSHEMDHFFCSATIMETKCGESTTQSCLFPLYLYPEELFSQSGMKSERKPNLNSPILEALKDAYHRQPSPEDIFQYIYAVLYAPSYRSKYAEFLRTDFPRVPFTKDRELFTKLAALGKKLVDLHLLRSPELDKPICRFQGKGDNRIEKQVYNEKENRVYINKTQYFEGVEPNVWEYQIGGYQVLDKWLKDRKKRLLSLDDIKHYCRVVTALAKTIEVQGEIDKLYPNVEKDTVLIG
jgi:predicted helicase